MLIAALKYWHEKFDSVMIKDGFTINECDKYVYTKTVENACIIVCLYVDDMLIFETNIEVIKSTKRMLSNNFDVKDLRAVAVILGIEIIRTTDEISPFQSHYVYKIERFKKHEIKENMNSFLLHTHLHKNTGTEIRQLEYSQIIGSLIYFKNCTRPDIAYAVSKLNRYTSNPNDNNWTPLLRVVGYIYKIREYALRYRKHPPVFEGYNDANWITDSDESKSTSGYIFTLGGAAVS